MKISRVLITLFFLYMSSKLQVKDVVEITTQ